jgi:hypothetical protein
LKLPSASKQKKLHLTPVQGSVFGFLYKFPDQAYASDAHPCLVIACEAIKGTADYSVTVLPITHSAPRNGQYAQKISGMEKRTIGLDPDKDQYIYYDQYATFLIASDLDYIGRPPKVRLGDASQGFLKAVIKLFLEHRRGIREIKK